MSVSQLKYKSMIAHVGSVDSVADADADGNAGVIVTEEVVPYPNLQIDQVIRDRLVKQTFKTHAEEV